MAETGSHDGAPPWSEMAVADLKLILKRAHASRPSSQWSEDDYDVLESGTVVGRIFRSPGAPNDRSLLAVFVRSRR